MTRMATHVASRSRSTCSGVGVCPPCTVAGARMLTKQHQPFTCTHSQLELVAVSARAVAVQVLIHTGSSKLITASQDGLVAVHDISSGLNQDDGFIAALNVGTSVEQLGLYGSEQQHMWCRTGTETVQIWDWLAATIEDAQGGDVAVADLAEARQMAVAAAAGTSAASLFAEVSLTQPGPVL
eukprot:GHUV01034647.1.p1 GENE.GHUV01034647.1~~GHUV01034647.1.p1  ORF type:complete len:182 (-),score=64.40 GHUV01034647.1:340-885(-)